MKPPKNSEKIGVDVIIFDFDGVLVDTGKDIANAANYTLRSLGLPEQPLETIPSMIGGGAQELLRRLLGESADRYLPAALPVFIERYKEFYFIETTLYPGVDEGLEALHRAGKRMSIATNKLEPITIGILEKLGVQSFFEVIVGPESVQHRKPHPEALLKILDRLSVAPARALMIGDTAGDIQAGQAAGAHTCGVTYGFGQTPEILAASPSFIIHQFEELMEIII